MAGRSDIWLSPLHALAAVRGVLFPWVPVFIAVGIALWFGLGFEPGPLFYAAVAAVGVLLGLGYRYGPELAHPLMVIGLCAVDHDGHLDVMQELAIALSDAEYVNSLLNAVNAEHLRSLF